MSQGKDIKFTQDSYIGIALKIIDKAVQGNEKGVNIIFVDQRQGMIDGRVVSGCVGKEKQLIPKALLEENKKTVIPQIRTKTVPEVSEQIRNDFEEILEKLLHPRLDSLLLLAFSTAMDKGDSDPKRGQWLGIGQERFAHYRRRFNLTKNLRQENGS